MMAREKQWQVKDTKMDDRDMTYEEGLEKLKDIVAALESGKLSLSETVKSYEEAKMLLKTLNDILEDGKRRITLLEQDGSQTDISDMIK